MFAPNLRRKKILLTTRPLARIRPSRKRFGGGAKHA